MKKISAIVFFSIIFVLLTVSQGLSEINYEIYEQEIGGGLGPVSFNQNYIFIGIGDRITILRNDPENFVEVGTISIPPSISDIAISGDFLFALHRSKGFDVYDISDINKPEKSGNAAISYTELYQIEISGNYAFVCAPYNELMVLFF